MIKDKKNLWAALGLVAIISFTFSFLAFYQNNGHKYLSKSDMLTGEKADKQKTALINENTEIITRVIYEQTGQEELNKIKPTQEMIGLSKKDLEEIYNGWIIDEFSPAKVQLTLRVGRQAEGVILPKYYLGIKDGYVAVYKKTPSTQATLKQLTKIPIKSLPEQETKDLERGIQVQSEQELLEILEGLSSYGEY